MTNKKNAPVENDANVGQTLTDIETYLKKNGKTIGIIAGAVVVVALAIFLSQRYYFAPLKEEAKAQTFTAEQYFRNNDWQTALSGDGNALGFADIIDQYGSKAGNAVYFYAGICQLQLKNYDEAITYLKKYKTSDKILSARALSCLGDAYVGVDNLSQALSCYKKAVSTADNAFAASYLLKAGQTAEALGNGEEALKCYETISVKYPQSIEAVDINKYISRLNSQK